MTILLTTIHVLVCIFLILVVLLQTGKGADLAGAFGGGGSQTAFGARGATTFLHKLTTAAAVAFMTTSLILAILATAPSRSIVTDPGTAAAPATDANAPGTASPGSDEPAAIPSTPAEPAP